MRALLDQYGLETVWAVTVLLMLASAATPARSRGEGYYDPAIADCPPSGSDCEAR